MSRYRDTEEGTVCKSCGALLQEEEVAEHKCRGTENRSLAEGERSSALTGVAPQSVSNEQVIPAALQKSTFLPVGAFRTSDHMYYFNGEGPVPGATSVLEVLSKPALVTWKAQEAAKAMLELGHSEPEWFDRAWALAGDGHYQSRDDLIRQALQEADNQRDTAAQLGTSIHLLADMVSREVPCDLCGGSGWITGTDSCGRCAAERAQKGFQVSEREMPYLDAWRGFLSFLEAQEGRIVSSEHMVWSLNGYGGTYDLIVELPCGASKHDDWWCENGHRIPEGSERCALLWLLDIKTSKGYYPEYGLQLAAYRWADSIILEGNPTPYPMPEIHRAGVLHLRPDQYPDTGWRLIEYPITYEKDYMTFLGALEIYRWRKEGRFLKSVLNPITSTDT